MFYIDGKYGRAKIFAEQLDDSAISQIIELCNQPFTKDSKIRIMPDAHKGAGCVIGFTALIKEDMVIPNLVGVDLSCGMLTVKLGKIEIVLEKLDEIVHKYIPSGFNSHETRLQYMINIQYLRCIGKIPRKDYNKQIGTLGGGNHFIEIDKDNKDNLYLVIHSGSRNLGLQIAKYYQDLAVENCSGIVNYNERQKKLIEKLKSEGKQTEIQNEIKKLKKEFEKKHPQYPKNLCFLTGLPKTDYYHDAFIAGQYAQLNRETMANIILDNLLGSSLENFEYFHTTHNYIGYPDGIIRKGAVSAYEGEELLIPINMRDGSLLCIGKGNKDWNCSAPHGAGRLMSRRQAKDDLSMEEFKEQMKDVYSTSVKQSTLDEAPMAYKSMEDIVSNIQDTVEIVKIIKPIYNFKAS